MGDTVYIRIGKVDGPRAILRCLTGFDGHVGLLCTSRSFALMVLHDARESAMDFEYVAPQEPASLYRTYEELAQRAKRARSPLNDAIPYDAKLWEAGWQGETWKLVEAGWERLHDYDLEVEVTDPKYVSHLVEGQLFATAAFDAWCEDEEHGPSAPDLLPEALALRPYMPGLIRTDDTQD